MDTSLARIDACVAIAERRDASKFPDLVGALADPDWRVRRLRGAQGGGGHHPPQSRRQDASSLIHVIHEGDAQ